MSLVATPKRPGLALLFLVGAAVSFALFATYLVTHLYHLFVPSNGGVWIIQLVYALVLGLAGPACLIASKYYRRDESVSPQADEPAGTAVQD